MKCRCCVCGENGSIEDPLICCREKICQIAVHKGCYGIVSEPEVGNWSCDKCIFYGGLQTNVRCQLCPFGYGALKKSKKGWTHIVCALYIPEVQFGNVTTMEPIIIDSVPGKKFKQICYLCAGDDKTSNLAKVGACMFCNMNGCGRYFHVTCAQRKGFLREEKSNKNGGINYVGYCSMHIRAKGSKQPDDCGEPVAKRKRIENKGYSGDEDSALLSDNIVSVIQKLCSGRGNFVMLATRLLFNDFYQVLDKPFYEQDPVKLAFIRKCLIKHFPSEAGNEDEWKKRCNYVDEHLNSCKGLLLNDNLDHMWWKDRVYSAVNVKAHFVDKDEQRNDLDDEEELESEEDEKMEEKRTPLIVPTKKINCYSHSAEDNLPLLSENVVSIIRQLCLHRRDFVVLVARALFDDFHGILAKSFCEQDPVKIQFIRKCIANHFNAPIENDDDWNTYFCSYVDEHVNNLKELLKGGKLHTWWNGKQYRIANLSEYESLETELDKQDIIVEDLKVQLETSKDHIKELTGKYQSRQIKEAENLKKVQEKNVELTKERDELLSKNRKSQTECFSLTKQNTAIQKTLVEKVILYDNQKRQLEESDNQIEHLTEKCQQSEQKNIDLGQKINEWEQTNNEWEQKSKDLQQNSKDLEQKSKDMEQKSKDLEQKSKGLEQKSKGLEQKSKGLEQKSKDLEQKSKDLEQKSKGLEQKSKGLEQKSKGLEQKSKDLEQKSKGLEQKSEGLEQKSKDLEQKSNQLNANLMKMNNYTVMVNRFADKEQKLADLKLKMAQLESKNDSLQSKINQLQHAHSS